MFQCSKLPSLLRVQIQIAGSSVSWIIQKSIFQVGLGH
jgi:hypothetical protein